MPDSSKRTPRLLPNSRLARHLVAMALLAICLNVAPAIADPTDIERQVTPTAVECFGDCDGNGQVTVDEIVLMINIAFGNADVSSCQFPQSPALIDVLMSAVANAMNGCPGRTM